MDNQPTEIRKITDKDYFNMIDNQVRTIFAKFEVDQLLKKAEKVLETFEIKDKELKEYPVEGYYYKSDKLRRYFKVIRNFQENEDIFDKITENCEEFNYLKDITDNEIFGKEQSTRRESTGDKPSPMPRRFDIIAMCMMSFSQTEEEPWAMDAVIERLEDYYTDTPNLVELAYLTKEKECLVASVETNSLYRDFVCFSGCCIFQPVIEYKWEVSEGVEDLGQRLVEEYNKIIENSQKLKVPTLENHIKLDKTTEKPRVARLGFVRATKKWYYWTLQADGEVVEEYTRMEKTTESESGLVKDMDIPKFFEAVASE